MITRTTPWSITLEIDGRSITIDGDLYPRADFGMHDFCTASWGVHSWDDGEPIGPDERIRVLRELEVAAAKADLSVSTWMDGMDSLRASGLVNMADVREVAPGHVVVDLKRPATKSRWPWHRRRD
jgi:hypothetical protein